MDNQYGYNTDNQYGMNNQYGAPQPNDANDKSRSKGFAIAAFVIALVNLILCSCSLTIIAVPLSLIFAIITLAGHRGGKVFAIISIVISVISSVIFAFSVAFIVKLIPDFEYFVEHENQIVSEYNETGEVPEYYQKYEDPKFDKYWSAFGYENFNSFFGDFINGATSGNVGISVGENSNGITVTPHDEQTTEENTPESTTATNSSDELVVLAS